MHTTALAEIINRARTAVMLSSTALQHTEGHSPAPLTKWQARTRAAAIASAASLPRLDAVTARAGLPLPSPTVTPTKRAKPPLLAAVVNLDELRAGPRRLLELVHSLGVHVCASKGYAVTPSQVTYHHSQELLALALKVTTRSVQKWQGELEKLGYIATAAHYGGHKSAARIDGLLIAVSLQAGHRAKLHYEDLAHQWRDLEADRLTGKTAWAALKWLRSQSVKSLEKKLIQVLELWAVTSAFTKPPLLTDYERAPNTVQDVIYTLPLLAEFDGQTRAKLVSSLADALAHSLNDHHSRAFWASKLWQALQAEDAGISALSALAALLARLQADMAEWPELRKPAALFVARLQAK